MTATAAPPINAPARPERPVPPRTYGPRRDEIFDITMGTSEQPLGVLQHVQDGPTECSQFSFDSRWLSRAQPFSPSPDLRCHAHGQWKTRSLGQGSPFFAALADSQPDGFANAILERTLGDALLATHPLAGMESHALMSLCAVHDLCRLGALRPRPRNPALAVSSQRVDLPISADLDTMLVATAAFERGEADERQSLLLLASATALGGSRPKVCFVQHAGTRTDGALMVARLPSVFDRYPVAKAEMLLGQVARASGIRVVDMALKNLNRGTVLITQRLDRDVQGGRQPYLSAKSLLLAQEGEELGWMDLLKAMRACCNNFETNAPQLWRRLVFTRLVNADVSLRKIGFLYSPPGRWRLAPATGFRPAMEPEATSVPSGAPGQGLGFDVEALVRLSPAFEIPHDEARKILKAMVVAIDGWQAQAVQYPVRMTAAELASLEALMDTPQLRQARGMVGNRWA